VAVVVGHVTRRGVEMAIASSVRVGFFDVELQGLRGEWTGVLDGPGVRAVPARHLHMDRP